MPFTISHAAVVLPFARLLTRWRLLSAVVIGAMVPDFGLFFPWRMHRFETHSAFALLTFCLPVGLATYWAFQYLIKTPMLEVLPEGAYARWRPYSSPAAFTSLRQWLLAGCGVLAGAVTHLIWDAFTHENARGVRMIPWLEEPIVEIGNHHMAGSPAPAGRQFAVWTRRRCLDWFGMACAPGQKHPCPSRPFAAAGAPRMGEQPISSPRWP